MARACAVAVAAPAAPSPTARFNSSLAPRRSFPVSCRHEPRSRAGARNIPARVPARFCRNAADAEGETEASAGQALQDQWRTFSPAPKLWRQPSLIRDDSSYLWKLGLGSVGGAAAVKYGSILLPDLTRPNIVQALLMVSLPVAAAVLILLKLSSTED